MKANNLFLIAGMILYSFVIGCDRPECKNLNPIFDTCSPESFEYKKELAKQLNLVDKSKLTFWLKEYREEKGNEELLFNVQGDGLCAVIVMKVENWNKMELVRQKKGVSFRGALFQNLKFEVRQNESDISFIYRDLDRIID